MASKDSRQRTPIAETVKVILRIRPRLDALPDHFLYQEAIAAQDQNPDGLIVLDEHRVKLLPYNHYASLEKTLLLNAAPVSSRDKKEKVFSYDFIFPPSATQDDIYDVVADNVLSTVQGYNSTVFAYGPTGSGKSHTMNGTKYAMGVIPRVIQDIFQIIDNTKAESIDVMFHVEMSYVELYNNGFRNLLKQASDELGRIELAGGNVDGFSSEIDSLFTAGMSEAPFDAGLLGHYPDLTHNMDRITVHESTSTGVFLSGINLRIPIKLAADALKLVNMGNRNKAITATRMNEVDSRSHTILTVYVESKVTFDRSTRDGDVRTNPEVVKPRHLMRSELRLGKIHLVDLAGSDRLTETRAEGTTMKEQQNINKSLLALGEVLHTLSLNASIYMKNRRKRSSGAGGEGGSIPKWNEKTPPAKSYRYVRVDSSPTSHSGAGEVHVPYFDSKLTHLLKDSLGGNSKTIMITTVGSELREYHHTLYALQYALRATKVRNLVSPNRIEIGEADMVPNYTSERDTIRQLKDRLMPRGTPQRIPSSLANRTPMRGAAYGSGAPTGSNNRAGKYASSPAVGNGNGGRGKATPSTLTFDLNGADNGGSQQQPSLTLEVNAIQAQNLKYVSFPLCPRLRFTVDTQHYDTIKKLYARSVATFPDTFEFAVSRPKFESGMSLSVEAVTINPSSDKIIFIGEGSVAINTVVSTLNNRQVVTVPLRDGNSAPAGRVLLGARLVDRPLSQGGIAVAPEELPERDPATPVTPKRFKPLDLEDIPDPVDGQSGALTIRRIVCYDMTPPSLTTPSSSSKGGSSNGSSRAAPVPSYDVVLQTGKTTFRSAGVQGKQRLGPERLPTMYAAVDDPRMVFDVDYHQLPNDSIHAAVYEIISSPTKSTNGSGSGGGSGGGVEERVCVGRAKARLISLLGRNDGVNDPGTEFAMQLRDEHDHPVGKVSLFLHFSNVDDLFNNSDMDMSTVAADASSSPNRKSGTGIGENSFSSSAGGGGGAVPSATKYLRSDGAAPRLNNVWVPPTFKAGWIRINSITATNLNKFRLVGNTARYKHLRDAPMTPVPAYLKHSELLGKQDPFVVVEVGDSWSSYSKVLLNQGWNCQWDQVSLCCYLSSVEASEKDMKIQVYDRSCSGFHNVFIGAASVPLVNLFAPNKNETAIELSVVDRRGKLNGKLEIKYTYAASDEKERWVTGVVKKVCGGGYYDILYDDGEKEFSVGKDLIRLVSRTKIMSADEMSPGRSSLHRFSQGHRVEVNDRGKNMWFPAWVVKNNMDGTYDIDSAYDVVKVAIPDAQLRLASDSAAPSSTTGGGFDPATASAKKLSFEESSVATTAGTSTTRRSRYRVRDRVEANFKSKGTWYAGKIFKVHAYDGFCTYDVDYLTGEYEVEVAEDKIRPESTVVIPSDATSAYALRSYRAQRPVTNVDNFVLAKSSTASAPAVVQRNAQRTKSKFQTSDPVEVNYRGHGRFVPAVVEFDYENGMYDVVYSTGDHDVDVPEDMLRRPRSSNSHPQANGRGMASSASSVGNGSWTAPDNTYKFAVGDLVEANYREIGKWIPGKITRDRGHGVFDIHFYDGYDETKVNYEHIRLAGASFSSINGTYPSSFGPAGDMNSKFTVGQNVEANCEGLGVWYHALVRNVLPTGEYNVQYDDGETEYNVNETLLRPGGAYSPGISSLRPYFREGDRVKVACRSIDVEHEMRSLSAIKQRIMEERKKLAESKLVVAKREALVDTAAESASITEGQLQAFKNRVGYTVVILCCDEAEAAAKAAAAAAATGEEVERVPAVSDASLKSLDDLEAMLNASALADDDKTNTNITSKAADGAKGEHERDETLNDAVSKAIAVEESLAHIACGVKVDELVKAKKAHEKHIIEKSAADDLALQREIYEEKARRRNSNTREDELQAYREAYQNAETELRHIMAARQFALEEDEALKNAKQKADLEAKCNAGAQQKGELAVSRLHNEDKALLSQQQQQQQQQGSSATGVIGTRKVTRASGGGPADYGSNRSTAPKARTPTSARKPPTSKGSSRQQTLSLDFINERESLRFALLRVKEEDDELAQAKQRAEQAGKEYAAADEEARKVREEVQSIQEGNKKIESGLSMDSKNTSEYKEYWKAVDAINTYISQAQNKRQSKTADVHKAEAASGQRAHKEETAAVAGHKRALAEEAMLRTARTGDVEGTKRVMKEVIMQVEQQADDIIAATISSKNETTELISAKFYADEEQKMYVAARDIAVLASGLLRVIISDQKERDYSILAKLKETAAQKTLQLAAYFETIAEKDTTRCNTTAAALTEAHAIRHLKAKTTLIRTTITTTTTTTTTTAQTSHDIHTTKEKTTLGLQSLKAGKDRNEAEEKVLKVASSRAVYQEKASHYAKVCEEKETIALNAASTADEFDTYSATDRFKGTTKEPLSFSVYSAEECAAVNEAISQADAQCGALDEARSLAIEEIDAIDAAAQSAEDEFGALSILSASEREELRPLLGKESIEQLKYTLEQFTTSTNSANAALDEAKERCEQQAELLRVAKLDTQAAYENLHKVQEFTRQVTFQDFGVDRSKVSAIQAAQSIIKDALSKAAGAESKRSTCENLADEAAQSTSSSEGQASSSERVRSREEEAARLLTLTRKTTNDDEELELALIAAIMHAEVQVEAIHEAKSYTEKQRQHLISAHSYSIEEKRALMVALSKEEKVLLIKAKRDLQQAETELASAKSMLQSATTLYSYTHEVNERDNVALDYSVVNLERAAKELVSRGDDDIDEYKAYQIEFKYYECSRADAGEAKKERDMIASKAVVTGKACIGEEETVVDANNTIKELEKEAAAAEQSGDPEAEVKALKAATVLAMDSVNAVNAAKEYSTAEQEVYDHAQRMADTETEALSKSRAHAEEAHRLLMKALSVLPAQHRTPMGTLVMSNGDGLFTGSIQKPRKAVASEDEKDVDPRRLRPGHRDGDDCMGDACPKSADSKDDSSLPSKDKKNLNWEFGANPLRSALRESQEQADEAAGELANAKRRTVDAEEAYRRANAKARQEGDAVDKQEQLNASTSRRLYDSYIGVEKEFAQLEQVRSDLSYENKCTIKIADAKEAEVAKVTPPSQSRLRLEETAEVAGKNRAVAEQMAQQARQDKNPETAAAALKEAKKYCDQQAAALHEAALLADKETAAWQKGTKAAQEEEGAAGQAHKSADEEARLLGIIRAAQLGHGIPEFLAAQQKAEIAKNNFDEATQGLEGFYESIEELRAINSEKELELSEESKRLPDYTRYLGVRKAFDSEEKRAAKARKELEKEVMRAKSAAKAKDAGEADALTLELRRMDAEGAADEAQAVGDPAAERAAVFEAKNCDHAETEAYGKATKCALEEAEAWDAARLLIDGQNEALISAHDKAEEATNMLVAMRAEQIQRETTKFKKAQEHALDCSNEYDAANRIAMKADTALNRTKVLLGNREGQISEEVRSLPEFNVYLDLVSAMNKFDTKANKVQEEKLKERGAVDPVTQARMQEEKVAETARTQRELAEKAVVTAQKSHDDEAEIHSMHDVKKFSDDEEMALIAGRERAEEEAARWEAATQLARDEGKARISAKDNANNALRLLNALRLDQERQDLDNIKVEDKEAEKDYYAFSKAVKAEKAKALELAEKSLEEDTAISPQIKDTPEYDQYIRLVNDIREKSEAMQVDPDDAVVPKAKAESDLRKLEEEAADKSAAQRTVTERSVSDAGKRGELEAESEALEEANAHLDNEEDAVLAATEHGHIEYEIWKSGKADLEKQLSDATALSGKAREASRLLGNLKMRERGRLAEAVDEAVSCAADGEQAYILANGKAGVKAQQYDTVKGKAEMMENSIPDSAKSTPEFKAFAKIMNEDLPSLEDEAQTLRAKKEADAVVATEKKDTRLALEEKARKESPKAARGVTRGNTKKLAAKYDDPSKTGVMPADESLRLTNLLELAGDETDAWVSAKQLADQEREKSAAAEQAVEQGMLLLAAIKVHDHEQEVKAKLETGEGEAAEAKEKFYQVEAELEQKNDSFNAAKSEKDDMEKDFMGKNGSSISSPAYQQVLGQLADAQARAAAAKKAKEDVVAKAEGFADARAQEKVVAADNYRAMRKVKVAADPDSPPAADGCISAPMSRLDTMLTQLTGAGATGSAKGGDRLDDPTSTGKAESLATPSSRVVDGETVTLERLRGPVRDFGARPRPASPGAVSDPETQLLVQEQVHAAGEDAAMAAATQNAQDEAEAWKNALTHAAAEKEALDAAQQHAEEAKRLLGVLSDDFGKATEQALKDACGRAGDNKAKYEATNGSVKDFGDEFEKKKVDIAEREAELSDPSRKTPDYKKFEIVNRELQQRDEPAILAKRKEKLDAAAKAKDLGLKKELAMQAAEGARSRKKDAEDEAKLAARRGDPAGERAALGEAKNHEADEIRLMQDATQAAVDEDAAWGEADELAKQELGALQAGIEKEDYAIQLLKDIKADQDKREQGELDSSLQGANDAKKAFDDANREAEEQAKIYEQKKDEIADKDGELSPETKKTPKYKKFEKIKAGREDEDEPKIYGKRRAKEAAAKKAQDLVDGHRKINPEPTPAELDAEKAAWNEAEDLAHDELDGLDSGIGKEDQEIPLLKDIKADQDKREQGELDSSLQDAADAKKRYDALNEQVGDLGTEYEEKKALIASKEAELTPETRETSPPYKKFDKIRVSREDEDEPLIYAMRRHKQESAEKAAKVVDAHKRKPEASLEMANAEKEAWDEALELAQEEKDALDTGIGKEKAEIPLLEQAKNEQNQHEKDALAALMAEAEGMKQHLDATMHSADELSNEYERKKAIIVEKDDAIMEKTKASNPLYKTFEKLDAEIQDEHDPSIYGKRKNLEDASKKVDDSVKARNRYRDVADEAELARKNAEKDAKDAAKRGDKKALAAAQEELRKREAAEKQTMAAAAKYADQEEVACAEAEKAAEDEKSALVDGITTADKAIKVLDSIRDAQDKREKMEVEENEVEADRLRRSYLGADADTEKLKATYEGKKKKMVETARDIAPETRQLPEFKKYEKIKLELEDEDEPYVFKKRKEKEAAVAKAQEVVTANKRAPPTADSTRAERDAWKDADKLAEDERDGLRKGIKKADLSIDLLNHAKNDELKQLNEVEEIDLREAKRRAAAAEDDLAQTNAEIDEVRGDLEEMKKSNVQSAEDLTKKGPEFKDDVVQHKKTVLSIDTAEMEAMEHRDEKEIAAGRGDKAKAAVKQEEEVTAKAFADKAAEAEKKAEVLAKNGDTTGEADAWEEAYNHALDRRQTLVLAKGHAEKECDAFKVAKKHADDELDALKAAQQFALKDKENLNQAQESKAYRSGVGFVLLKGGHGEIDVAHRKPFDKRSKLGSDDDDDEEDEEPIDPSKLKPGHSDDDTVRAKSLGAACKDHDHADLGDGSTTSKSLFEFSGDWTSDLEAKVRTLPKYTGPPPNEYMPTFDDGSVATALPENQKRRAAGPKTNSDTFCKKDVDGKKTNERMHGIELFRAAVRMVMRMGMAVQTMGKALHPDELNQLRAKMDRTNDTADDHHEFLTARAPPARRTDPSSSSSSSSSADPSNTASNPRHADNTHLDRAKGIKGNVADFLNRGDELVPYGAKQTKKSPGADEDASSPNNKLIHAKEALKSEVSRIKSASLVLSKFKKSDPHVKKEAIHSLIHGPQANTTDLAVLEEEEDVVVETVKETTKETTQSVEKTATQTQEETSTQETEVVETVEVVGAEPMPAIEEEGRFQEDSSPRGGGAAGPSASTRKPGTKKPKSKDKDGKSKSGKASSSGSVASSNSRGSNRSSGSRKDEDLMREMMSGNVDL